MDAAVITRINKKRRGAGNAVSGKNIKRGLINAVLVLLCILLLVLLVGMIVWSSRKDAADSRRLQELAAASKNSAWTEEQKTAETAENQTETKKEQEKPAADKAAEETPAENEEKPVQPEETPAKGVVCWGDDLINGEESSQYSYKAVLQKLLQEGGYELPVVDKTIQGGGTLSMMTMAGVPEEDVQGFIESHKEAADGGELHITETGIRDLTPEQLDRNDADCIPVIFMGYYGGWNHDPKELAEQQQKILDTFQNKDRFIVVGTAPMDGSVDAAELDAVMNDKWGEHYISAATVSASPAASNDGQAGIAKAVFEKLEELSYITK